MPSFGELRLTRTSARGVRVFPAANAVPTADRHDNVLEPKALARRAVSKISPRWRRRTSPSQRVDHSTQSTTGVSTPADYDACPVAAFCSS